MALLFAGQESPSQGLILDIVLIECEGGDGLGHLIAEVEGMGWSIHRELGKNFKRVFSAHEPL